ncbi:MAG: acyl carrier protein [Prevotellaceae bacterium]|nr:acyl carrier protein [Candidatus Faecinaster equi]
METNQIIEKLTEIFRDVFAEPELTISEEMTAADVERWDSLTNMQMITEVENQFGIKFKLKDLRKLNRVGDLIDTIAARLAE